ncbi:hypothetical protein JAN5088_00514 [Jannaschia rubra]|uniref:Uncharacterized protein n=1 Tax=Jannaschia rubra TaxID=282197 RepID=A0A0M6XNS1_9RHOB|nr:hypothetical protein [Jannaschia rubra]CTQ31755.1 hypothetical protein JAN5088_00514 [Jannaschia rubra]SFG54740.1 dimethylglycine dehydrogenase [Jannaschia rubra]
MNIQRYSMALSGGQAEAVDHPIDYHVTVAIRLAQTPERTQEFEHVCTIGAMQGLRPSMVAPDDIRAQIPSAKAHDLPVGF